MSDLLTISPHFSVHDNFITLSCTDGDSTAQPKAGLGHMVASDGKVDYMEKCKGDHPTLIFWREKVGTFLAKSVLHLPGAGKKKYLLSALPHGYCLFIHKKGDRHNPRTDAYLWGSTNVTVFRSPAEFFFHAKWILLGCPKPSSPDPPDLARPENFMDRCGCTYCSGVGQGYISRHFSNYTPQVGRARRYQKWEEKDERKTFQAKFEGVYPEESF